MLACVLGVESSVARHWREVTDPVAFSWRFSARAAAREAPGCRLLCLGDSLAKHGLLPAVLGPLTGRRTYNLAAAAAPAPLTYFVLKRALDAGSRPDAVLLELKPSVLAGGPRFRIRDWPEVLSIAEWIDLAGTTRGGGFVGELLVSAILPSYRARHDLRDTFAAALRGERPRLRDLNAICDRNWTLNHGANLAPPRPGFDGRVSEAEHRDLLSHRFAVHRVNARYVRRTLELLAERGIRTSIVLPPFAPEVAERRRQTGVEAAYSTYIQSLRERFAGLTVLDARRCGYPARVFVDPIHLDRRGAARLSMDVGEALREALEAAPSGPGRWVDLPSYRDPPEHPELEDAEQSRVRLGIAWRP